MTPVIAIHGGAGVRRSDKPSGRHRAALERALEAGHEILKQGGTSLDAVVAAVVVLEDSPLFNAGRGSSFNSDGEIEMDASIMEGATLRAGAVAAVRRVRNPILAARAVMDSSPHVLLAGSGAERFARKHGLRLESPEYFHTARRLNALRRKLKNYMRYRGASLAAAAAAALKNVARLGADGGLIAVDRRGNVAMPFIGAVAVLGGAWILSAGHFAAKQ